MQLLFKFDICQGCNYLMRIYFNYINQILKFYNQEDAISLTADQ